MKLKNVLFLMLLLAPVVGFCQSDAGFPVVQFQPNSRSFTSATAAGLPAIANEIKRDPSHRVVIVGNGGGTKYDQQLSWSHIDAFIEYMSETQNIDRNTFIFQLEGHSGTNAVMLHTAGPGEDGPSSVPPPHPGIIIK